MARNVPFSLRLTSDKHAETEVELFTERPVSDTKTLSEITVGVFTDAAYSFKLGFPHGYNLTGIHPSILLRGREIDCYRRIVGSDIILTPAGNEKTAPLRIRSDLYPWTLR